MANTWQKASKICWWTNPQNLDREKAPGAWTVPNRRTCAQGNGTLLKFTSFPGGLRRALIEQSQLAKYRLVNYGI
jgi:hypothetical protein